ncbi:MAG: META domain-containing protein [Bacteroidota bacterium]
MSAALVFALSACGQGSGQPAGDPLNGTSWALASIDGAAALPNVTATAAFADGQVSGSGGCNSYGGSYTVNGDKIQIKQVVSTLMACADQGVMDQESAFVGALSKAKTFTITDGKLEIQTADGKTLAFSTQK